MHEPRKGYTNGCRCTECTDSHRRQNRAGYRDRKLRVAAMQAELLELRAWRDQMTAFVMSGWSGGKAAS